ncbi:hypothetical protein MKEN_00865900 [Mycena kentingensis (nom. inval.)]|nr:hypothetical protein MKEN_00865900 [Mycena kentingensis (nom. inval.)]
MSDYINRHLLCLLPSRAAPALAMSTTYMNGGRPMTPDPDLEALYSEVLAAYSEQEPEIDYGSSYSSGPSPSTSAASPSTPYSDYSDPAAAPRKAARNPSVSVRRLPVPPTPSSPSAPMSIPMPEPEPFNNGSAPSPRPSVESYGGGTSSDLLRQATTGSMRRLPSAPGHAHRPSTATTQSSSHYGGMSRQGSFRPPGAAAPMQPGSPTHESSDSYVGRSNGHGQLAESQQYRFTPTYMDAQYSRSDSSQALSRNASANSTGAGAAYRHEPDQYLGAGPPGVDRRPSEMLRDLASYAPRAPLELHENDAEGYWEDDEEDEDETRWINFSLLSHCAVQLRDKVPRGTHVKGSIPYPRAFTGKDIVNTIQTLIQRELALNHGMSTDDRRAALQVARSLQSQLFFYEVEWGGHSLQDSVEDVYMFLDDQDGTSDAAPEREELPTGVVTMLTKCYSPSCTDDMPCYVYACPRRGTAFSTPAPVAAETPKIPLSESTWANTVPKEVLAQLPESEINRQTIIHKLISKEAQYIEDLDAVETVFLRPLRAAIPPVIPHNRLEDFIDEVFGNILDLRVCNERLLEVMRVRQREQAPVIQRIGDIFLQAAADFRLAYPIYIGQHHLAEKRLKDEMEANAELRLFLEQCSRHSTRSGPNESMRLDLKHFLNRPAEHLQKYPVLLEAIYGETAEGNPDADYLLEAIGAIKNLQSVAQLRMFQVAMGKGNPGKWEWHDLVAPETADTMPKEEKKRQAIIFEVIKGEMAYVKDMQSIQTLYVEPLRNAQPPIIPHNRLDMFIQEVFHNFSEIAEHHARLLEKFHELQREQHPAIRSITSLMFDAALNFRDAYMEYIPNYPIAAYRIDDEMANNPDFKSFVDQQVRHADAHRLDMKNFINRPIPRLLRYELLLKGILDETPTNHEDRKEIPQVLEVIKALGKDTEPGVVSAKQKVELWRYNSNLVFKQGEAVDMDLLDPNRSLIFTGKVVRQPDNTIPTLEWSGWSELYLVLFDNYFVMTKPKERDGITKYQVNRRPIPLDLLTLVNFTDPPTQRGAGLLRNLRGGDRHDSPAAVATPESASDSRVVYPWTIHHNGRLGGAYILFSDSAQARTEWKQKLEEALGIRKVVQESNRVFEVETLSADTFLVPSVQVGPPSPQWNQGTSFTGKVTCSVPFNTADGRGLVAIGCAEGVWIGFRHDPRSLRRVLHLKMVSQAAMLEEFGIFLVLADKSLFAYHIEALVPSSPHGSSASQVPQKLNGTKDVHFFSVGTLHNRTLVIYMKKKGLDSIFRVLEPVSDKINERTRAPAGLGSRLGFRSTKSEWFRIYRDFFLPSESFDLYFLKARIAILCTKGFEIMDLNDFKSVTIPLRDDARLAPLSKRCDACRPIGMFRSDEDGFLLCYNEFGVYVDKHGDPRRGGMTIEWEGNAEKVALHSPYILLFDSRFIEIRHIETGRLVQIIPGNDIRCIWDGRGVGSSIVATPAVDGEPSVQDAQIHAVMNGVDPSAQASRPTRALAQHVFELVPTIPLYLPEKEKGPSNLQQQQPQYLSRNSSYSPPSQSPIRGSGSNWR